MEYKKLHSRFSLFCPPESGEFSIDFMLCELQEELKTARDYVSQTREKQITTEVKNLHDRAFVDMKSKELRQKLFGETYHIADIIKLNESISALKDFQKAGEVTIALGNNRDSSVEQQILMIVEHHQQPSL